MRGQWKWPAATWLTLADMRGDDGMCSYITVLVDAVAEPIAGISLDTSFFEYEVERYLHGDQ